MTNQEKKTIRELIAKLKAALQTEVHNEEITKLIEEAKLIQAHAELIEDHKLRVSEHLALVQKLRKAVGLHYFIDTHKN